MSNENVSLPVAEALASALVKIEAYVPTGYVDNSEPDIDAEHLNHAEQGIMRVTNLLNAAVDVIQGQESRLADAETKIGTAALTGGMTDLSSGVNSLYSNLKNTVYGEGWQSSYSVSVPRSGSTALVVASGRNDPGMYLIYGVGQTANVMPIFEPAKTGELITYSISGQQVTFSSPENRGYNYGVVLFDKKL